ncbi:MAG: cell division protein FtsZ [Bacteroidota bacterium]|jgi:cell division protein FtsZ
MIHFDLPKEKSSIIKVIGVGGGGSNAVNHMHAQAIEGVNFIICNTDAQAIAQSSVPNKIQLGPHLTQGLGAGANPDIGRQATEESLEEIKRILEVNTKMAFITAGMGGGTGTGGAPIIAKICKDLGILTVGIVTTPFGYEGKKRFQQANEGIARMKDYVDTLLIISNDKLRHQFGNLKMKEAFSRADNVLATAAKCITDVISSTGQINVDFADVCTVMRNGGKAILGNGSASGENRAQVAIEEALNSPLLDDNDIRGARWILINITSAEGEHEYTMDEVEVIQNYVLAQAGEDTDVILGIGYDSSLEDKIGITVIATGFECDKTEHNSNVTFASENSEKVVIPLAGTSVPPLDVIPNVTENSNTVAAVNEVAAKEEMNVESKEDTLSVYLTPDIPSLHYQSQTEFVSKEEDESRVDAVAVSTVENAHQVVSGGYLTPPSVIYEDEQMGDKITNDADESNDEKSSASIIQFVKEEEDIFNMQLVEKEVEQVDDIAQAHLFPEVMAAGQGIIDEEEDQQRRKAAERLQKLRNLSFNIYGNDVNNDFDSVPAYVRRNLELYSTISPAENFYSNYTVKADENNQVQLNNLNSFLDGNKPD